MEKLRPEQLREKANMLPLLPGVYIMLDEHGEVIYIGKAKALKNRVTSYFRGEHLPKVAAMVAHVADFNVIVVQSEFEALVLENSLIKLHKPKYNILLKDDKGYPFVRLDVTQPYPTFSLVNRTEKDGAKYFGPYGGRSMTAEIIDTVCKTLRLPTCTRRFPRDIGRARPCLNYHMGTCAGYCLKDVTRAQYLQAIREAEMILDGRTAELTAELTEQMQAAAEALRFEYAASLRDRLRAIEGLKNHQRVIATAYADTDAVGFARGAKCCFTVLHFTDGNLTDKDKSFLEEPMEPDGEALAALVQQYYESRGAYPRQVLLPCPLEGQDALEQLLTEAAGHKVTLAVPQRGDKCRLTEMADKNAREEILIATTKAQRSLKTLEWLQRALELDAPPERIEAFDISNLGDSGIVAGMTVFQHGRPRKSDYRKFRIRTTDGQNDYGAMHEALTRRFQHYVDGDPGFCPLPDLLLIDGGAEHATRCAGGARRLRLCPCRCSAWSRTTATARARSSRPAGMRSALPPTPRSLPSSARSRRRRTVFPSTISAGCGARASASELDQIPGVGEKRRNALLREFRSVKAIRAASYEALCAAVPAGVARAVYDHYHPKGESPCV